MCLKVVMDMWWFTRSLALLASDSSDLRRWIGTHGSWRSSRATEGQSPSLWPHPLQSNGTHGFCKGAVNSVSITAWDLPSRINMTMKPLSNRGWDSETLKGREGRASLPTQQRDLFIWLNWSPSWWFRWLRITTTHSPDFYTGTETHTLWNKIKTKNSLLLKNLPVRTHHHLLTFT